MEDINRKAVKDHSAAGVGRGFTWRFEQPLSHGWSPPPSKLMPASATLGQILLNPPGLTPSHSAGPVSSTSDPGSAILGAPDRCQGPLTLTRGYHIHQVDQRSDLSLFFSDPSLLEVSRSHANMMEVGDRNAAQQ